ncbi:MAG: glycosyltransferase family 2 protein [Bacilli bacterium]
MKKIKVSVIVPIYNSEKYLSKCLDSLVKQTLNEIQIILVNDGSSDNSEDICKDYCKQYRHILYLKKENGGQASARNLGVSKASGEFLSFIDSDDYINIKTLAKAYEKAVSERADIVVFDIVKLTNENEEEHISYENLSLNEVTNYVISDPSPCNKIFRRKLFSENNVRFLEGKIYEDLAVIPTLVCYTNKICHLNEFLYYYVIHDNSTMRFNKYSQKLNDIFYALDFLEKVFIESKKYDNFKEEIEFIFIEHLLHGASLRFLNYREGHEDLQNIRKLIKEKYPRFYKNKYFKLRDWKYKLFCNLIYYNQIIIIKKIIRSR